MGIAMSFYRVTPDELALAEEDPGRADDLVDTAMERAEKDGSPSGYLDKSWDGLNFLFKAARVPVDLQDDIFFLDDDGHLSGWDEQTVAETARILRSTSFDDLARHYDPVTMTEQRVYPRHVWIRDGDETLNWLRRFFDCLVAFFDDTAARGGAVIKSVG